VILKIANQLNDLTILLILACLNVEENSSCSCENEIIKNALFILALLY